MAWFRDAINTTTVLGLTEIGCSCQVFTNDHSILLVQTGDKTISLVEFDEDHKPTILTSYTLSVLGTIAMNMCNVGNGDVLLVYATEDDIYVAHLSITEDPALITVDSSDSTSDASGEVPTSVSIVKTNTTEFIACKGHWVIAGDFSGGTVAIDDGGGGLGVVDIEDRANTDLTLTWAVDTATEGAGYASLASFDSCNNFAAYCLKAEDKDAAAPVDTACFLLLEYDSTAHTMTLRAGLAPASETEKFGYHIVTEGPASLHWRIICAYTEDETSLGTIVVDAVIDTVTPTYTLTEDDDIADHFTLLSDEVVVAWDATDDADILTAFLASPMDTTAYLKHFIRSGDVLSMDSTSYTESGYTTGTVYVRNDYQCYFIAAPSAPDTLRTVLYATKDISEQKDDLVAYLDLIPYEILTDADEGDTTVELLLDAELEFMEDATEELSVELYLILSEVEDFQADDTELLLSYELGEDVSLTYQHDLTAYLDLDPDFSVVTVHLATLEWVLEYDVFESTEASTPAIELITEALDLFYSSDIDGTDEMFVGIVYTVGKGYSVYTFDGPIRGVGQARDRILLFNLVSVERFKDDAIIEDDHGGVTIRLRLAGSARERLYVRRVSPTFSVRPSETYFWDALASMQLVTQEMTGTEVQLSELGVSFPGDMSIVGPYVDIILKNVPDVVELGVQFEMV